MAKRSKIDSAEITTSAGETSPAETSKKKTTLRTDVSDDLSKVIAKNLEKKLGKDNPDIVQFFDEETDGVGTVVAYVPTGCEPLNFAISNRRNGGYPCGRFTEILGLNSAGKSLLAAHALAETQKLDGVAVLIDTEASISLDFLQAIGVQLSGPNKLLVIPADTVEVIFEAIENIVNTIRNVDNDRLVTIVVDSVSAASTDIEMESDFGKDGYATTKAIIISKAMRKLKNFIAKRKICVIFTNQYRMKMNAPAFASPYTTSGGMAIPYHASVRIELSNVSAIKKVNTITAEKEQIGNETKAKIVKNKIAPPFKTVTFNILYDSGIDDLSSWLDILKKYKVFTSAGSYLKYKDHQFFAKDFPELLQNNPGLKEELYDKLCEVSIVKYKNNGSVTMGDDAIMESEEETFSLPSLAEGVEFIKGDDTDF